MANAVDVAHWRMGGITVEAVEDYVYNSLPARDAVLAEMEKEAAKNKVPIVGPAVGRILYQLAKMINAKTVFEMGSAIGYSTIWWAGPACRRQGFLHRWRSKECREGAQVLRAGRGQQKNKNPHR